MTIKQLDWEIFFENFSKAIGRPFRALDSNRQIEALVSVIFVVLNNEW